MRIRQIGIMLLLWLVGMSTMQAQTFDKLWKQVEQAEKKSLPQTVIQLTNQIYLKGQKEESAPQMLKAYLWRMKYREMLTPDSFSVSLKGLEQWAQQTKKPMERAVLHSLMASIYADYAADNSWSLREGGVIVDEAPSADMREWTANMFVEQVNMHTREAMADSVLLLNTSSRTYIPFVVLGEASEYYHHDMYHLLASRGIKALSQIVSLGAEGKTRQHIDTMFRNMLTAYHSRGDKDGYVLASLDYLEWQHDTNPRFRPFQAKKGLIGLTQDPYLAGLNKLVANYQSLDVCAEVYLAKANAAREGGQRVAALQLCDDAIRLYPAYRRIGALKNVRENILAPALTVDVVRTAFPGQEVKVNASFKNLDGFTLKLYQGKQLKAEQHYATIRSKEYRTLDSTYTFKAPEIGTYTMHVVPDVTDASLSAIAKKDSERTFMVTRIKVLTANMPGKQYEIVTLDAQTGHPIPNVAVTIYNQNDKVMQQLTTNAVGKVITPWVSDYRYLKATKGFDAAMLKQNINNVGYSFYEAGGKVAERMTLLTDRSLYRSGQTVYVKGIAYEQGSYTAHVIPNKEYEVVLKDVNNQETGRKTVRTNQFGSFATDFALPAACLNGLFTIHTGEYSTSIRVEDYKRPTFDITFDKQQSGYQLGDKVRVKGMVKSYSGVVLRNLPVKYTVTRSTYTFWRFAESTLLASGEVMLNDNGEFSIPVSLEASEGYQNDKRAYYRYRIEATVTNVAGETQSSTDVIAAGNRSLVIQAELGDKIRKTEPVKVVFNVRNLNGEPVEAEGTYRLFAAKDKERLPGVAPVATGVFTANKEMKLDWKSLPSGAYVLNVSVKDSQGAEVTEDVNTVLFSVEDKRPPVNVPVWFYEENMEFDATHPAVFYFGTSEKNAYVLMNVFSGGRLLESKAINLSDSIERFEFPYRESYGKGVFVNFCLVRNGQVYQQEARLEKRFEDRALTMKWDVFRDKLHPGQKEEWKLTIRMPEGKAADAEMLATMYDASLDKIWNKKQGFNLIFSRNMPYFNWTAGYMQNNYFNYWWDQKYQKAPMLVYDHFVTGPQLENLYSIKDGVRMSFAPANQRMLKSALVGSVEDAAVRGMNQVVPEEEESLPEIPADVRTNFAETAFFYPQLRTNEQGEIVFSFTMPESLTRWNFRGYSHTKEMMTGILDGEATTSKEFMLTPNLPRFVRVGDKTAITASIANMTGKAQGGMVTFTLFDPATEKVISIQKQKFTVEAGKTIGANFLFTVSDKWEVLGCRMIADSGMFSDGEQQLIPVLSNKEYLTETLPMAIRGEKVRTFSLDTLFNHHSKTATDRRLTVEFTGNPAWYAIQALPSLSLPVSDNAISWATAYYANTLAAYIMNSQPRIKAVFDSWKLQGGTKETLLSNLQKNQEVKNILLSESPWVLEAQTEQQQKERIATLFDLNNIRNNNSSALVKLKELQNASGAWSWYKGMNGSLFVTTYITQLNARLAMLIGKKPTGTALELQNQAFAYLHQSALEEYRSILKSQKEGVRQRGISENILQYLYLVAISGEQIPAANQSAYHYYITKVSDLLTVSSMNTKAIAAIVLDKAGRKQEAQTFIASLKEHLTTTDAKGMFFAFNESLYAWGGMNMQAHVDVMEALEMTGSNSSAVEEMKIWLLTQKQTQQWNSPVATADAVYALLMNGVDLLDNQGDVRIVIGDETLETVAPSKTTVPGLGYIKRSFTEKKVVDARTVQVEKKNPGIAWGAIYAQYESPISDVKQQGGELNVLKQLYVERMVNNVAQWQPITANTVLAVGDKVVSRLSIRAERTMDFVQLKDQRGACFEPIEPISGYQWSNGIGYYVDIKDASTNFFFDHLGKGVYVLEYSYRVSRAGTYETGLATMQCAYAPEYASHSASTKVEVKQ